MPTPVTPGQSANTTFTPPPRGDPTTAVVAAVIQKNWESHYRAAWGKLGTATGLRSGASWNWAAAFFQWMWLAYRRQWGAAALAFIAGIALAAIPVVESYSWLILFIALGMYGDRIVLKQAWEAADLAIRSNGSVGGAMDDAAAAGGTSSVVLVILMIPVGVVLLGIMAAIAIPKIAGTKGRAYQAMMVSDLSSLRAAQETYFADSARYTDDLSALGFAGSRGVTGPDIVLGPDSGSYTARVRHTDSPKTCALAVGTANPLGPAEDGVPVCR